MTLSVHSPFSRLDVKTEHRLVGILNQTSMKTHCWVDINLQCWRDVEFWLLTTMMSNYKIRCQRYFDVRPRPDIEFWSPNITTLVASLVGSIPTWMTVTELFLFRGPFSEFQVQLNEAFAAIQKSFFYPPAQSSSDFRISLSFLSPSPDATQLPPYRFSHFYFCSFSKGEKYWLSRKFWGPGT